MTTLTDHRPATATPNLEAVKSRQHAAWSSGDYAVVGVTLQIVGENLAEAMDLRPGEKVLDVAAGNGNFTLAAARRWCHVTSTDYVDSLLERGKARAAAEGLAVSFAPADAENLPFVNGAFDAVASTFGVMFTPDHARSAGELLRVCRKGGRIGLANWTPEGFIGQMFRLIGKHLPPPAGAKSPSAWGTGAWIETAFGPDAAAIVSVPRHFVFRYRSAQHFLDVFRQYYGPMLKAFEALDAKGQAALAQDILDLAARFNTSGGDTMVVPAEYLETVVTRR